jgi:hypothetical protein
VLHVAANLTIFSGAVGLRSSLGLFKKRKRNFRLASKTGP